MEEPLIFWWSWLQLSSKNPKKQRIVNSLIYSDTMGCLGHKFSARCASLLQKALETETMFIFFQKKKSSSKYFDYLENTEEITASTWGIG
jgi:hypothetical protein